MGQTATALTLVSLLLAAVPVCADDTREAEVPLYTNADLEPLPEATGPAPEPRPALGDDAGWEFVERFLASHRERLEAERAMRIELQRIRAETEAATREQRYALPLAPYGYYGWYPGRPRPPRPPARPVNPHERVRRLYAGPSGGRIEPLHARPGGRVEPLHAR